MVAQNVDPRQLKAFTNASEQTNPGSGHKFLLDVDGSPKVIDWSQLPAVAFDLDGIFAPRRLEFIATAGQLSFGPLPLRVATVNNVLVFVNGVNTQDFSVTQSGNDSFVVLDTAPGAGSTVQTWAINPAWTQVFTRNNDFTLNDSLYGASITVDNSERNVTITLPDATVSDSALGPFARIRVGSPGPFWVKVVASAGQMRSNPGLAGWDIETEEIFLGFSLALQDEIQILIQRWSSNFWNVIGPCRAAADDVHGIGGGAGSGHIIQEDGGSLSPRPSLNFGTGLTASDDSGNNRTNVVLGLHTHTLSDITDSGELAALDEADLPATTADFRGSGNETLQQAFAGVTSVDAESLRGVALDASVATPSDGNILVFRDVGSDWVLEAKPAGASPNVNDLGDVTITAVADNEVLAFNSGTGEWINQTPAEAGLSAVGHTHALNAISDVEITDVGNNEVLAFDTGTGNWVNQTSVEAGLQASLASSVTTRGAGTLDFSGGTEGQVWTVVSGNVQFADASSHTHVLADITDAGTLAGENTVGTSLIDNQAVTLAKIVDQGGVTPASYTNANITVSQEGIITAVSSGSSTGGLSTAVDSGTELAVGAADGTHKILDAATAVTLALDPEAAVATRQAFTPGGAGAITVEAGSALAFTTGDDGTGDTPDVGDTVTGGTSGASAVIIAITIDSGTFVGGDAAGTLLLGEITGGPFQAESLSFTDGETATASGAESTAGYWLPGDDTTGSARTTSFGLTGYGYLEVFRNSGGSAAEWAFIGESDHDDLADNDIDFAANVVEGGRDQVLTSVTGALTSASHSRRTLVLSGNVTVPNGADDVGFEAKLIATGAQTVTFNATTSPAMAAGDVMTVLVESTTVIKAVLTEAADLVSFT